MTRRVVDFDPDAIAEIARRDANTDSQARRSRIGSASQ
jgi:hypothetical protein